MIDRSQFLRGSAVLAGAGALVTACSGGDSGSGPEDPEATAEPSPWGEVDRSACPVVERMGPITGPEITTRFRMEATDLGAPAVTPDGRILFIFGDTFEAAVVGGGFWRSPVGLFADPDVPLDEGITWTSAVGGETAEQLVDYEHDDNPVSTILPGDPLTVGETMYLWMMVNHGLGNVAMSEIWTSEDSGETWARTAEMFPGDHAEGFMQQCTWYPHPTDGHVYLLTTGFQRDKGLILSRVPQDSILEPAAYETLQADGTWGDASDPLIVLEGSIGEMTLRVVEDQWLLTYFDARNYRACIIAADSPEELAEAEPIVLLHGGEWGKEEHNVVAQLYGPYIVPGSTLDVLHLVCSQWHTGPDWPYHVEQYRIEDPLRRRCAE